jgi:hypothetical protein
VNARVWHDSVAVVSSPWPRAKDVVGLLTGEDVIAAGLFHGERQLGKANKRGQHQTRLSSFATQTKESGLLGTFYELRQRGCRNGG